MKKIEFTKDQFKDLLELVYLGEHMANAHRVNDTIEKYRDLFHHIFEHAADYGQQDSCIPFDPLDSDPRVYPNADFEADTREFVEEYDENTFWDNLAGRLAHRDFIQQFTEEEILSMDRLERFKKIMTLENHYHGLLSTKGITNCKLE